MSLTSFTRRLWGVVIGFSAVTIAAGTVLGMDGIPPGTVLQVAPSGFFYRCYAPVPVHDGYEQRYGLNPLDAADSHVDDDGDGLTNV